MTTPLGPMRNSVGIREVRSDGVQLRGAMVLDVIGGGMAYVASTSTEAAKYVLTLTAGVTFAAVKAALAAANSAIDVASQKITGLGTPTASTDAATKAYVDAVSTALTTLTGRVTALEARFTPTALKTANYTAVAWEHVLVDMAAAAGNVTITMPTSPAPSVGDRVKVSDVSTGGGVGVGFTLRVAATFAPTSTTHYAASPYAVADIGSGGSVVGANAELVYVGTGWYVATEACQPVQLA
jgi:hypothetical protein